MPVVPHKVAKVVLEALPLQCQAAAEIQHCTPNLEVLPMSGIDLFLAQPNKLLLEGWEQDSLKTSDKIRAKGYLASTVVPYRAQLSCFKITFQN